MPIILLLILVATPASLLAQVNNGAGVSIATNSQYQQKAVLDGSGGAIIVWSDIRSGQHNIFAQRISASGVALWGALSGIPVCTVPGEQYTPDIVSDGAGGAIVTWRDDRMGADIYAQRLSPQGVPQWTVNGVPMCKAASEQREPVIASDGSGGAIVAWIDFRNSTYWRIFAQRISAAGDVQWSTDGVPLAAPNGHALGGHTIVSDGSGGAIVAWSDDRTGSTNVYAQRLSASGVPQWNLDGLEVCIAPSSQDAPRATPDDAGGTIVCWMDHRDGPSNIYAQRITGAGVTGWSSNGVAVLAASQLGGGAARIASNGSGGAIVVWNDLRNGAADIFAQQISSDGVPQWTANGVGMSTRDGTQFSPSITGDGVGGAIVAWVDELFATSYDIYVQRIDAKGSSLWGEWS